VTTDNSGFASGVSFSRPAAPIKTPSDFLRRLALLQWRLRSCRVFRRFFLFRECLIKQLSRFIHAELRGPGLERATGRLRKRFVDLLLSVEDIFERIQEQRSQILL
jgi:hypothetical protein